MSAKKLSSETLQILKNFSEIRNSFIVDPGNVITVTSPDQSYRGDATVQETFEVPFAIFEMSKFLSIVSLFDDPTFEWSEKWVTISGSDGNRVRYVYADRDSLNIQNRKLKMSLVPIVEVEVTDAQFTEMRKSAAVLGLPHVAIESDGKVISLLAFNKDEAEASSYRVTIGAGDGTPFRFVFDRDKFRFIPGTYKVQICNKIAAKFCHTKLDVVYILAYLVDCSSHGS